MLHLFLYLKNRIQNSLIVALGGHNPVTVRYLIYRAGLLADQATSGKFSAGMKPLITEQVRNVRRAIMELDSNYARVKGIRHQPGLSEMEIVLRQGEGWTFRSVSPVVTQVRAGRLLAASAAPTPGSSSGCGGVESRSESGQV